MFQIVLNEEAAGNQAEHDKYLSELFKAHIQFTDAVRRHFNRPKKVYMAVPMIQVPENKPRPKSKGKKAR